MIEDRLKGAVEEANMEKALKEVAKATTKEKGTVVENVEERARAVEKARALAQQNMAEIATMLGEIEL